MNTREPKISATPDYLIGLQLNDRWTWTTRDVVAYALAIGACPPQDLDYIYERNGLSVYSLFTCLPLTSPWSVRLLTESGYEALFLSQRFRLETLPSEGEVVTEAIVTNVWDSGRSAIIEVASQITSDGNVIATGTSHLYIPGAGGFGGDPAPSGAVAEHVPISGIEIEIEIETRPEQAAAFRTVGDYIERAAHLGADIHVDPEAAERMGLDGPITPGICVLGVIGRALELRLGPLTELSVRYLGVAYPGAPLRLALSEEIEPGSRRFSLSSHTDGRPIQAGTVRYRP